MVAKKIPVVQVGTQLVALGVDPHRNNGVSVAPAFVTRVWDSGVNVRVLCDGPEVLWWTSVAVHDSLAAAEELREQFLAEYPHGLFHAVAWPDQD